MDEFVNAEILCLHTACYPTGVAIQEEEALELPDDPLKEGYSIESQDNAHYLTILYRRDEISKSQFYYFKRKYLRFVV